MSNIRTPRTSRTRLLAAAATVAIATLSLTACNDGTGVRSAGTGTGSDATTSSSSVTPSTSPGASTDASSGTSGTSGSSSSSAGSTGSGTSGGEAAAGSGSDAKAPAANAPAASRKDVTCEGSNTKTVAAPLNRPVNHMLLTVTNTGSKTCFLYGYPSVQFTGAQSVPPVIEASQPQAVVTLEPGQSGYASVSLSATDGSGASGYTANSLAVHFHGRSMSGSVGAAAHPSLPAKGVYIDDSIKVTYWQQEMNDAISW
ncbi:DUF4232 domain-containing protein [Streptomyces sp. NPDC057740]|uniref:DUF4232 domain-containing protein n=1 Tax=Streptomyces sp. NPDC057740 TaxID=3346234 RepID=UPI0036893BE5